MDYSSFLSLKGVVPIAIGRVEGSKVIKAEFILLLKSYR
jgi:hypothetical protein